jgi:hypothetical protein
MVVHAFDHSSAKNTLDTTVITWQSVGAHTCEYGQTSRDARDAPPIR